MLLLPTMPRTAPFHNEPIISALDCLNCALSNALELPATAIPMGLSDEGLPLGLQVSYTTGKFTSPVTETCQVFYTGTIFVFSNSCCILQYIVFQLNVLYFGMQQPELVITSVEIVYTLSAVRFLIKFVML